MARFTLDAEAGEVTAELIRRGIAEASRQTGLKVASVVRFDKIATLDRAVIAGRVGEASDAWLTAQRNRFFGVFGFHMPPFGPSSR